MMYSLRTPSGQMRLALLVLLTSSAVVAQGGNDQTASSAAFGGHEIDHVMEEFKQASRIEDFSHAVTLADRIVQLLKNSEHKHSINHAKALHNLANAQQAAGLRRDSRKNYEKSIKLIEQLKGSYAPELPSVIADLGLLYYDSLDFSLASDSFLRAQHITHRTGGVHTLKQLKFVDWITIIKIRTADGKEADRLQRFYYFINEQNYGEDDPRMLPAMHKMADWFRRSGQLTKALVMYEKTISVINDHKLDEIEKLRPLRGISTVTYLKGSCCDENQLTEVLDIVTGNPGSDHMDELDALVHIADMHIVRKRKGKAEQYYQRAWDQLVAGNMNTGGLFSTPELLGVSSVEDVYSAYFRTVEGRSGMHKTVFRMSAQNQNSFSLTAPKKKATSVSVIGEPLSLCHSTALELARVRNSKQLEQYFVDVGFTVTREGRVSNVALIESNAPRRLQHYVTNMLLYSRYRPTIRDGKAVDTDNIKLRQTFSSDIGVSRSTMNRVSSNGREAVSFGCEVLATTS